MSGYLFATTCAVLLCACYSAGRAALPPRWTAAVAAGALCVPAAQFAIRPAGLAAVTGSASAYLVFAALPLLAGRYVAQQRRAAEQERLGERLRIARDMHDSLGRRLSLAAIQAAALEVSELPAPQRKAVARLATSIRASATELHEILSVVRGERSPSPGMAAVAGLVEEFRAAGAVVSLRSRGTPRPLAHAIRHAPGRSASVTVAWEAGTLLLTVVNAADCRACAAGSGLAVLAGQLRQAGGVLGHELSGEMFRLHAVLPAARPLGTRARSGMGGLGLAAGILLLVILPATVLLGVH
jgi:hypothetical protein